MGPEDGITLDGSKLGNELGLLLGDDVDGAEVGPLDGC